MRSGCHRIPLWSLVDDFFLEGYVFAGCFDCLLHFAVLCARLYESDLSSSFVKEISVVVEKEVPVIVCHESQLHIYRLEDGLRFDADLDMLKTVICV